MGQRPHHKQHHKQHAAKGLGLPEFRTKGFELAHQGAVKGDLQGELMRVWRALTDAFNNIHLQRLQTAEL